MVRISATTSPIPGPSLPRSRASSSVLPAIAVSQQSDARELDFRLGNSFDFESSARFTAKLVEQIEELPLPEGTLLNINCPAGEPTGVEVARLGKRIYRDELLLDEGGPFEPQRAAPPLLDLQRAPRSRR